MSKTLARIRELAAEGHLRISDHGYDELAEDDIFLADVLAGLETAVVVEDCPAAARGESVLVLQMDRDGQPIHVVWGIAKGSNKPGILVTAYRPDPKRWSADFMRRKR